MKTLILRLQGMQSWGDCSKEVFRHTRSEPTLSGVLGLLGAAMDIRTDAPEFQRFASLRMATRVNREGIKEVDYQNASGFLTLEKTLRSKNQSTEQTWRYYLADADFFVALTGEDELIDYAAEAVQFPSGHISLGPMCFAPGLPVFHAITSDSDPFEALSKLPGRGMTRFVVTTEKREMGCEVVYDGFNHAPRMVKSEWHLLEK